jgi:hypothetical protein
MTGIVLLLLAADLPAPAARGHTIIRSGIVCVEAVDPPEISITGELRLMLTATGDGPLSVEPVTFSDPPGWRVRASDTAVVSDEAGGKQQRWRQTFRLTPDKPGELPLQAPAIRVRSGGRDTPVSIDWPPITVKVTSKLSRVELDEARGITGPEAVPPGSPPFWKDERAWAALIVLVAIVTAVFAGRLLRRQPIPEPPLAEWVAAGLDRLGQLDPQSPASADTMANLLRGYITRRYHAPAEMLTTAELFARWADESADEWKALLVRCDQARFGGVQFSAEEWTEAITIARRLTLPVDEAAGSAATGEASEMA